MKRLRARQAARDLADLALRAYYAVARPSAPDRGRDDHDSRDNDAALEAAVASHRSLGAFLASPTDVTAYFAALRARVGDARLTDPSLREILAQLMSLNASSPRFAQRLWTRPEPAAFELEVASASSMRALNPKLWRAFCSRWLDRLRDLAGVNPDDRDFSGWPARADRALADLERRTADFQASLAASGAPRADRLHRHGRFFAELRKDSELERVSAYLLLRYLVRSRMTYLYELSDADQALDFFRELRESPRRLILPRAWSDKRVPFIMWRVHSLVPRPEELLADRKLLVPLGGRSTLRRAVFKTFETRPLHAIWTGAAHHDCVGGDLESLRETTARRWAIGALEGARTFWVDCRGHYQGIVRTIPITTGQGQKAIAFDVTAAALGAVARLATPSGPRSGPIWDAWLGRFRDVFDFSIDEPLVLSDSTMGDVSQLKPLLIERGLGSEANRFEAAVGARPRDPDAALVLTRLPANDYCLKYGPGFITDALLVDAKTLFRL